MRVSDSIAMLLLHVTAALWLSAAFSGCAADRSLQRFEFTRLEMGVQARIVLYAPDFDAAEHAAADGFATIARLDAIMSDYRPDSELMRLCAGAGGPPMLVSDDLMKVLIAAQDLAVKSDGDFDVTIGPLSKLWRAARRQNRLPEGDQLSKARELVGWKKIALDVKNRTVQLTTPGVMLDLGGIAKGYAAQCAVQTIEKCGFRRCMVALAGDIALGDSPPNEKGWRIAVKANTSEQAVPDLLLHNVCISSSGDAEQFIEVAGVRYSHIIDPRTGLGTTNGVSATVVASRGELADALASTLCVLEDGDRQRFVKHYGGVAAILTSPHSTEEIIDSHHLRHRADE